MFNPTCVSIGAGHNTPQDMNVIIESLIFDFDDKIRVCIANREN